MSLKRSNIEEEVASKKSNAVTQSLSIVKNEDKVSINNVNIDYDFFNMVQAIDYNAGTPVLSKLRERVRRITNAMNTDEGREKHNRDFLLSLLLGYTDISTENVSPNLLEKFSADFSSPETSEEAAAIEQMKLVKKFTLENVEIEKYKKNFIQKNLPVIQEPFFCDYGFNMYFGKNCFFNFNCVVLDVCPVFIGKH